MFKLCVLRYIVPGDVQKRVKRGAREAEEGLGRTRGVDGRSQRMLKGGSGEAQGMVRRVFVGGNGDQNGVWETIWDVLGGTGMHYGTIFERLVKSMAHVKIELTCGWQPHFREAGS